MVPEDPEPFFTIILLPRMVLPGPVIAGGGGTVYGSHKWSPRTGPFLAAVNGPPRTGPFLAAVNGPPGPV